MVVTTGVFWFFTGLLGLERLIEMIWARGNEKRLVEDGYVETGRKHFPVIVLLHILYFASLIIEFYQRPRTELVPLAIAMFAIVQLLRLWAMITIGRRFTTGILVKKRETLVARGPYKFIRHPIYLIVELEILTLALVVGDVWTAIAFGIANALLLWLVRIPAENLALASIRT